MRRVDGGWLYDLRTMVSTMPIPKGEPIMREDGLCPVCMLSIHKTENWERIKDEYEDLLNQVDTYGEVSLTEQEQVLYHNGVHVDCFEKLE